MTPPPIDRIEHLEDKVDGLVERMGVVDDKVDRLRQDLVATEERLREGMVAAEGRLLKAIDSSNEETRRHMLVLHEEVLTRIRTISEGRA